jgi:dihydroorotate dehydrogenase (NAD+) catalytic subunit
MADLSVKLGSLELQTPIIAASGTFGYGLEYTDLVDLNTIGGIVVKGLSPKPRKGNPTPRIVETACGMLNSIGLANIGVDTFINDKLPELRKFDRLKIFANVYGHNYEDYVIVAKKLAAAESVAGIELNLSCPNVDEGGLAFGTSPKVVEELTKKVRDTYPGFLFVKLTPNVTDVTEIAKAAQNGGADAVSLINTLTGLAVDLDTRRPVLGGITGGLSGPAIKPVALRMVHQAAQAVDIPVIGIGGIMTGKDALEFMLVGATTVQVGTANFTSPRACVEIAEEMKAWLDEHGVSDVKEMIGQIWAK